MSGAACENAASSTPLFSGTLGSSRQLRSRDAARILAVGSVAAFGAHAVEATVSPDRSNRTSLRSSTFRAGAIVGGTPFELGALTWIEEK
jgi:hypothetical protein